uniref:hypothetical protein n=1 Tax=Anaerococcus mediterraneensis TaxID=1870984 RepID=UPI0009319D83|nr:hypothetical protein [Anaerococcus mediterraneensis]
MRTPRYIRGVFATFIMIISLIIFLGLQILSPLLEKYKIVNIGVFANLFLIIPACILVILLMSWSYRNRLNRGLKYAFTHYRISKKLRKQLIDSKYYIENKVFNVLILPLVKVEFIDGDNLNQGIISIENNIKFDKKLEDIRLNGGLSDYIVTQQYLSNDGNAYIYNISSKEMFNQLEFNSIKDYLVWSKTGTDDYSFKLSDSDVLPFHHMGIAAQTGGGKSFMLQSLLIQILNKEIKHLVYLIDPKSADLLSFGKNNLKQGFYADKEDAISMIEKFYNDMVQRKEDLQDFFDKKSNFDYQDVGLPARILVIDEFGALRASWNTLAKKDRDYIESLLSNIVFMGRQLGFFVFLVLQRFSAETVPRAITEQLVIRIVLSESDDLTYRTLFSQSANIPSLNLKPGMGFFSCPKLAKVDSPKLFVFPFCRFLKT